MKSNFKTNHIKILYIFFITLSLNIFFFSTEKLEGKAFDIKEIDVSRPFEINFDKNKVIEEGFQKAFIELISSTISSSDQKKIKQTKLNEIKGIVESFTIQEEKFIDDIYFLNLGVSFNRKKYFNYLENKNIFPSIPIKKKFFFLPIIIDENKNDLLIFNNNKLIKLWNEFSKSFHLIEYILPTEDLEDINSIKENYESIEEYNFAEIKEKYNLENSIIGLIFKNKNEIRILSRIEIKDQTILKNQSFTNTNINNDTDVQKLINDLKIMYEDLWKESNQINTSIKLSLNIKVSNRNNLRISNFEKILNDNDLVYDFFISKFDKDFTYYQIIFNGSPNIFLKNMSDDNYSFNTQNKIWILK